MEIWWIWDGWLPRKAIAAGLIIWIGNWIVNSYDPNAFWAGLIIGFIVMCAVYFVDRMCHAWNEDYPITQQEAYVLAGYRNIYDVPNFGEWRRVHLLGHCGEISWDRQGNIMPGKYAVDERLARKGLPQVYGLGGVNMTPSYSGPIYIQEYLAYCRAFGIRPDTNGPADAPTQVFGIGPQPSNPK